ncbi:MAG: ASKHA domain-containing protein [Moorellaceae bacterium]
MPQGLIVEFEPIGRRVSAKPGQTILEVAQEAGLALEAGGVTAPCGGQGLCGRCRVKVTGEALLSPTAAEKEALRPEELAEGYRLACQATLLGSVKVEIPPESMIGLQKLQVEGLPVEVVPEPPVARYALGLEQTTISHPRPVWQQVTDRLAADYNLRGLQVDMELVRQVSPLAAEGRGAVTLRGREIINFFWGRSVPPPVGLAVDLGTTKVAGFLVNLETGVTLAGDGIMNPQIAYGEDVMSRLVYALEGEEQYERIHEAIIEGLNRLTVELVHRAGLRPEDIEEAVIVGNTAMHHLLLRLPVAQLARAPYVASVTSPVEVKARDLGLAFGPGAYVYCMPVIAGFVGGDHVAMILGSRLDKAAQVTLGLDIGTNTEIVLKHGERMLSCSCASGPAFEGAHISQGMRAVQGAIQVVRLVNGGLEPEWETIGGSPPLGLCGSGILDAVAELYRVGIIDAKGRFDRQHPRVRLPEGGGPAEFVLVPAEKSGTGKDIVITQKDINEIQLAKAAIATGTKLLLETAGLRVEDVEEVVVAGAFGTHLKVTSAITIGMFPSLPEERFRQVGNAAGTGARLALLSLAERQRAEEIAGQVGYVELMLQPAFYDTFVHSLALPERRASL